MGREVSRDYPSQTAAGVEGRNERRKVACLLPTLSLDSGMLLYGRRLRDSTQYFIDTY